MTFQSKLYSRRWLGRRWYMRTFSITLPFPLPKSYKYWGER